MNNKIFDIRIKAWLCALAIFILGIGFGFGIVVSPKIVGTIVSIILFIIGFSIFLYVVALALDAIMD